MEKSASRSPRHPDHGPAETETKRAEPHSGYGILLIIALAGLADAIYLTVVHLSESQTCAAGDGCSAVLASSWAAVFGIPVAGFGAGMYLVLAWFSGRILKKPETVPEHAPWLLVLSAAGILVSGFLTGLQAVVIRQWCLFCLLSAGLVTAYFATAVCLFGKTTGIGAIIGRPALLQRRLPAVALALMLPPLVTLVAARHPDAADPVKGPAANPVVGTIGSRQYTLAAVDEAIRGQLQRIEEQRYDARKSFLENELIALEAERSGLTPDALIQREVIDKIQVKQEDIRRFIKENRNRLPETINEELLGKIEDALRRKWIPDARREYVAALKKKHGVRFAVPLPPRLTFDPNPLGGPEKGPVGAPVTIVEFSDFECPYCSKTHSALKDLAGRYPDKIRMVFRHFPLNQHKRARRAAEFAYCARQQNRFWPFSDMLFANQDRLSDDEMYTYARQAGIADMERFQQCTQGEAARKAVTADADAGENLGVGSTPTLFINGRRFEGLPKDIDRIIEEELPVRQAANS